MRRGYEWEGMKGWWYEALIGHGLMNLSLSHSEAIKTKPSSSRSINECPQSNNIISIHKRNFTYYIHFPSLAILQTIITLYRHRLHMTWSLILAKSDFATKPFGCIPCLFWLLIFLLYVGISTKRILWGDICTRHHQYFYIYRRFVEFKEITKE